MIIFFAKITFTQATHFITKLRLKQSILALGFAGGYKFGFLDVDRNVCQNDKKSIPLPTNRWDFYVH